MIHNFSCQNFYSIDQKVSVNFVAGNKAPDNSSYVNTKSGTKLSKVEAVIGPNASGKTNLLRVLPFLRWLIVDSFESSPEDKIPFKQYIRNAADEFNNYNNSEFSVTFELEEGVYSYDFVLNNTRIISESLKETSFSNKKRTTKTIFSRKWDETTSSYITNWKNSSLPKGFESLLRQNCSVVSTASRLNHNLSRKIVNYWDRQVSNIKEPGNMQDFYDGHSILDHALDKFKENEEYRYQAENMLQLFDLGFDEFDLEDENNRKIIHSFEDHKFSLPVVYESSGTKQMLIWLSMVLYALDQGGIAIIDEIDTKLHPVLTAELVNLFVDPEVNSQNAQLLFSTQNHEIMTQIDKYQITLTEKNEYGATEVWRLDDLKGVRSDDNYLSKYMANAYGAFPRV